MPYTPCHIAVLIPACRKPLVPSALAVGAMAPDIEYFLCCSLTRSGLHSWPGGLLWALPFGMAALWLWHGVLKRPLLMLLPETHQQRLARYSGSFSFFTPSRFCWILVSLLLGIASHITWDAFTHSDGWFVSAIPFLRVELLKLSGLGFAMHDLLQHVSSVAGGIALCIWYVCWYARAQPDPLPATLKLTTEAKCMGLLSMFLAAALPACIRLSLGLWYIRDLRSFTNVAGQAAVTGLTCGLIAAIVLSVLLFRRAERIKRSPIAI